VSVEPAFEVRVLAFVFRSIDYPNNVQSAYGKN